ncbi:hypothetical protein GCM10007977_107690 [Dactylosporangium sucinum]|uniref:Uncharacterized protein n=1 Tax=Dactylosporangium sucinum TaxID=1424081 RepID=A0A917X6X6_9ACTN|nr:hypothetical protein GCM10007977_107690 [Dactylosporangium sucinum]
MHHAMTNPQMLAASLRVLRGQLLQDLRSRERDPASLLPTARPEPPHSNTGLGLCGLAANL